MSIPSSFIDRLITSVSIVDIINRRVQLERTGGRYKAKCPFHGDGNEKTPSFVVYEETGSYHCFACKASGNAIHFLREYDGIDFMESVELLASHVGMEVPKQEKLVDLSDALNINTKAAEIFKEQLKSNPGKETIEYLKNRGISGETAKFFELGYSMEKSPTLHSILSRDYDETDLTESGLFGSNDNGDMYDRFRDRLMFPIRNIKGEHIAFGGRLITDKDNQAKYLNSPETKTYKKKYELYGLYEARLIEKRPESLFLVEGYMDVIGLHQHGIQNAVASSGTAFTQEQLRKILSYTNNIYIVFDGDEAGQKASWRAVENALPLLREDIRMSFIFLKPGDDPDSFIKEKGKDAFIKLANEATSFSDYFVSTIKTQADLSTIEGRSLVAQFAIPLVDKITNPTLKEAYISEIGHICDLDFGKLLNNGVNSMPDKSGSEEPIKKIPTSVIRKSVMGIFTVLIQYPKLASDRTFDLIKRDSRFLFLLDVRDFYKANPEAVPSILFEQIENEKIKNLFGEALVSEIKLSEEDACIMLKDCIGLISKSEKDRQEILKEKYNMQEITSAEKRELQQIILKKDAMSDEDQALLKKLSSK
ncbi:DNA primase [Gammaproteobacteria bacterium]|jgi:DNA primase|nr:DNA primase [Gammaproteobacteria bacterium]MDC1007781.1 DNA primase [Gammaproteobacteria bacterium]MDC3225814.1 DNA primase [Gammaproteobacteria bacterium]